ncbi:hypothetical protein EOPP23_17455 [Endozoicomonas sp. OPT23]|uniref:glycosyltransferase family 39 protein n=1 Tax=Endozoicomonas sp. OPT23 TaxID=2072845 RepID=UPI001D8F8FBE|nr:glycosyltransferase family 39 protein [Endozoicomonas sp. OPT23]MRI34771.1 hypothetical protein [Endozoicomonas sp. OPT23]
MVQGREQEAGWLIVLSVLIVHWWMAPLVELGVDEAHYALYALYPALSYFDHPPMVGWLQILVQPFGYNEFTLRLIPSLLLALSSWLGWRVAMQLFPDGHQARGLVAIILINTAPMLQIMGWGLVPDLPLMVLALLSVELIYKIHRFNYLRHWLLLGLVFGLAGLSKYTAVFLPLGLLLFMFHFHGLQWLKQLAPWLAGLIAFIVITPVLIWNAQHDWVSFSYQLDRGVGLDEWSLKEALLMQLAQAAIYSFLAYVAMIGATFVVLRDRENATKNIGHWLIVYCAWPAMLVISWSAGRDTILPNWPAMCWALFAPLSANWISDNWNKVWVKVTAFASTFFSLFFILFVFWVLAFKPLSRVPFMAEALRDFTGWQQAAERAVELKRQWQSEINQPVTLMSGNWSRASRLAWYAFPEPLQLLSDRTTQFDFWTKSPDKNSKGILVLDNHDIPESGYIQKEGFDCLLVEESTAVVDKVEVNSFQFLRCQWAGQ